jgi:hypothetical protein
MALLAHGNQPFNATGMSAAQLALLEEERLKRLEEERLKRLAIAQANQTPILQKDVGFNWFGLGNKTSLEEQYNLAGNMYPREKTPWGQVPFTEHLNKLPGIQIGPTAEEWAEQRVNQDAQDRATAQRNLFHRIEDQNPVAGYNAPTPSYTHIPEEEGAFKSGWKALTKAYNDFDSPAKGVCTLSSGMKTQQLDRTACDAAGGSFDSPQLIKDRVLQDDGFFSRGIPGAINIAFKQLGHIRETINEAQINDNLMQKAGFNWTPDKIAWIEKYGIRNLPGQLRDDTGGDTKETAEGRKTTGYVQEGLLSPDELQLRYPQRYADNAAANQGIWSGALKAAEGRDVTGTVPSDLAPPSFMQVQKAKAAALQQGTDARFDRRMGDDNMAAASAWADRAIDAQEAGQWADKAIDAEEKRIAGDISWKGGEGLRTGDLPVTVDSIADRLTEITSPDFTEQNDAFVDSVLRGDGFLGTALEYIGLIDGQGRFEGSEEEELSEEEANDSIAKIAELAEQTAKLTEQVKAEVTNVKDLTKQVDTEVSGLLAKDGGTADGSSTPSSLLNVPNAANLDVNLLNTTSTSTDGFTIDRLKNPFSKDNKAWWLEKRPGDIPGNNRAVEFFNALAYIGTPLKYRPAQTPSESLQDRKIKHMNNMMDYSASVASSAASANQNTFTKLKAAVPSQASIGKQIEGEFYGAKGFFEKGSETDRRIQARAGEIREKMLLMASQGIYPTVQKVYDAEKEEQRLIDLEKQRQLEEEKRKNPKLENEESWWSELWPF